MITNPNNNIVKKRKGRKRKGDTTESEHTLILNLALIIQ